MRAIEAVTTPGETAALCQSVGVSRASLYRRRRPAPLSTPTRPRAPSPRALGTTERQAVLDVLHSERFVDQSPAEVHATLLEEQTYLCSPRTMYRVLAAADEVRERRAQARHPVYTKPELVATGPNQVWSWDITKLKGPIPYLYYSLYVILDLFSRYVVGWMVALHENAHLAERLIEQRGGPRNSDRLLRWDPDHREGVWNVPKETELPGCQGRSKIRPPWRRKTRPLGSWVEWRNAAVRRERQDAGVAAGWRAFLLCSRR